jgi:hypothetical protein
MDNVHPLSTLMVIRSLDVNKDPLWPLEEILDKEVPYFSVIGALMYFTNYTKPNIVFAFNLLAKYSSTPIKKNIGIWLNIYFTISVKQLKWGYFIIDQIYNWLNMQIQVINLIPHKERSQTSYLFTYGGIVIS